VFSSFIFDCTAVMGVPMERAPSFSCFMHDRRAIIHGSNDSCMTGGSDAPWFLKDAFPIVPEYW
jgi:hypothetical protein